MAFCKSCGKEIGEGIKFCPFCGDKIIVPENVASVSPEGKSELVGTEVPSTVNNLDAGEGNGTKRAKIKSVNVKDFVKKNKVYVIIVAAVVFVMLLAAILIAGKLHSEKVKKDYFENLKVTSALMLTGASQAESSGNLIKSVWYNTIYEEFDSETDKYTRSNGWGFNDDFNDSLQALFSDSEFRDKISSIESNRDSVASMMKELKDPPKEYEEEYEALKDLYDSYLEFTEMVINPSGSLRSFSDDFNELDSRVVNKYNAMKIYIE